MHIYSHRHLIINIKTIIFILGIQAIIFAEQPGSGSDANRGFIISNPMPEAKKDTVIFKESPSSDRNLSLQKDKNLTELQKQARIYRAQGLEFQRLGNLDTAMTCYQKSIQLDPAYAVAYNDLGVVYEQKGFIDRAQECYLQAIKTDPNYLSAYTNLAYIYENRRDFDKAAAYWRKRFELGPADDPWTEKARQRLIDIGLISSKTPLEDAREQDIIELVGEIAVKKSILKEDDKELAKWHFEKAQQSYGRQDYATAIKEALDAMQLDPANPEISKFIEKVQNRALSR
jgi:tetratricopeptide (TPR) repeat protein